jgi:hypothetical protein
VLHGCRVNHGGVAGCMAGSVFFLSSAANNTCAAIYILVLNVIWGVVTPTTNPRLRPSMQAVVVPRHGGPEVLQLQQHPIPVPADAEVLIEQHCAGVNYIDTCDAMMQ